MFQCMRRNNSESLIFDPEPECTIHRRLAQQRLADLAAMANSGDGNLNAEMEAHIEAQVQARLAQRLQEQEQQNAKPSLRDLTAASMTYDYPGSIVFPTIEGKTLN